MREVIECLEQLKNSKIADSELFQLKMSDLCNSIKIIASKTAETVEDIHNIKPFLGYQIDSLLENLNAIQTLSNVMQDYLDDRDFVVLDNLIYNYNKLNNNDV